MNLLRLCVERAARRSGYGDDEAKGAGAELVAAPVMQTGPHALLIVEPDAFYTQLFSLMGLAAHRRQWQINYSVSTSAFKESAKKGPGWLRLEGEALNVFGLPRRRLIDSSIACFNGPYRFRLSNSKHVSAPNASAARLLAELPDSAFSCAAEAIRMGNLALWHGILHAPTKLLQLDDFDMADLIADHLEDVGSWVSSLFVHGGGGAVSILDTIDRLNSGPWRGWILRSTDFFWRLEEHKVVPLHLHDGVLRTSRSPSFEVKFTPACLAAALRGRAILPGMFIAYLVVSILPGVRVLGGCRQTVYLPLMRYLTAIGAQRAGDTDLLAALEGDERPGVWGHRVLRLADGYPFQEVEQAGGVLPLLSRYAEMPLVETSGDLASFTGDPIWAEISEHIRSGAIARTSDEWKWSGI
ncbi:hypothetical protein ASE37_24590 [Rhizobium sp. Root268]|nr:hypothetical protein ASC86_17825 [Rhizobium sp. Root1212]KRD27603.1 hypothetical protein ASE37_24590 [Rhizobium sp. Root268]